MEKRKKILKQFNAGEREILELLEYNKNFFVIDEENLSLPFPDEPFVKVWESYKNNAKNSSVFEELKDKIVQFNFPIKKGISQTTPYKSVVLKGQPSLFFKEATGISLSDPDNISLEIVSFPAGSLPFLIIPDRNDFVSIIQAITCCNEPETIPNSMGASMIAGYNNWDRIWSFRKKWEKTNPVENWEDEFKRIILKKELYQDKFVITSKGYYSAVDPEILGLEENVWKDISVKIRMVHEYTHYFTKRVLNSMKNNILDEFIADFAGLIYATGEFKPDWFLTFMGLENYPQYRDGGRLQNYTTSSQLSVTSFNILITLIKKAATNVDSFTKQLIIPLMDNLFKLVLTLAFFTIEELASADASDMLLEKYNFINSL